MTAAAEGRVPSHDGSSSRAACLHEHVRARRDPPGARLHARLHSLPGARDGRWEARPLAPRARHPIQKRSHHRRQPGSAGSRGSVGHPSDRTPALLQPRARDRRGAGKDARGARALPGLLRRRLFEGPRALAGELLLEAQPGDRPGDHRRPQRPCARTVDGLSDRLVDGARLSGRVRPPRGSALHLDPPVRALLPGVLRLAQTAATAPPRPARAAVVLGVARVLQPRSHLRLHAAGVPAARLPARADAAARARGASPPPARLPGIAPAPPRSPDDGLGRPQPPDDGLGRPDGFGASPAHNPALAALRAHAHPVACPAPHRVCPSGCSCRRPGSPSAWSS